MQSQEKIIKCYNQTAEIYAAERVDELSKKPFDRMLLKEFARVAHGRGTCADFGCGPGQITKFLYDQGLKDIVGIDISPRMIDAARRLFPKIKFQTGDLLDLSYDPENFSSGIAFYAIVHFNYDQIKIAFSEINRVLKKEGQFLLSFHVGDETVHFDTVGDKNVDIDLYFFQTDKILEQLAETGFSIIDAIERRPYDGAEYATRRAYIWAERK